MEWLTLLRVPAHVRLVLRSPPPAITTVTLIIGSVVYLKPTEVPRVPFTRDLVFLVLALLLILVSTSIGKVSVREVSPSSPWLRYRFRVVGWRFFDGDFGRGRSIFCPELTWIVLDAVGEIETLCSLGAAVNRLQGMFERRLVYATLLPNGLVKGREEHDN